MDNVKKILALVLAAVVSFTFVVGCGSATTSKPVETKDKTDATAKDKTDTKK